MIDDLQDQPCDCKACEKSRLKLAGALNLHAQIEALKIENEGLKAKIDELCDQLNYKVVKIT